MKYLRIAAVIALPAWLASCAGTDDRATLAQLRNIKIEIREEKIEGGLDKAIQSYQRFIQETPESSMTPEAIRRLADLKIEKEYGYFPGESSSRTGTGESTAKVERLDIFDAAAIGPPRAGQAEQPAAAAVVDAKLESVKDFEKRASESQAIKSATAQFDDLPAEVDGLENAGAREAIALYKNLLEKHPLYERNDQVLYHMSRAYEELGQVEEAMKVMNRLVKEYPTSQYIDEVQFRRGEYFFMRKKFLDAEEAYKAIADRGAGSSFYELGLYKLAWAFYKQELYEDSLHKFVALLDYKVSTGFDVEKANDEIEKNRVDDTYRVISLSFSNLGGADAVADYFNRYGKRPYEVNIYQNLGEYYLDKRRYDDAAGAYKAFVRRNPFHKVAPQFDMRVVEIYKKGGFSKLVIDASKQFATSYGLKSEYWKRFDIKAHPKVVAHLKNNLRELANHYHALYQDKEFVKTRDENFKEALTWYRQFLDSFPKEAESPAINYQLAELLLENKAYAEAASEYEKTAYGYPAHEKSSAAGYAAVFAHRENVNVVPQAARDRIRQEVIRSSLMFADTFPKHEKAAIVLGAAADDLFQLKDYARAIATGRKLIATFPDAEQSVRRSAWLVVAHASFESTLYKEAEEGYVNVLQLTAESDKSHEGLTDNLAASIYKQGEQASKLQDYKGAADHFLRIAQAAPTSKIRPTAEYDAATALMQLKSWNQAVDVLQSLRKNYPGHALQPEITKKMAFAYKETGELSVAAAEYERIETESKDDEVRRGALLVAGDLYTQAGEPDRALQVYRRYVGYFPKPVELALEMRFKIAGIHKSKSDNNGYFSELKQIVDVDARAGSERTDRTRYLGAVSALAIAEPLYDQLVAIKLVKPFEKNLAKKKTAMKAATDAFGKLVNYQVGEATAGATFYIAEIYYHFGRALMESERPDNLNALELEQYELAIEEQAYPFEEQSIKVHEKNMELLSLGVYNAWIDKSMEKLATLVPARYAKFEESSGFIESMGPYRYRMVAKPASPVPTSSPSETVSSVPANGPDNMSPPPDNGSPRAEVQ
jgi:TolA-binding protein